MTVINEFKDPMSGKVNHFAKGSIKFVNIKPVKNADADGVKRTHIPAKNGQPAKVIEATHSISFLMQPVDENNNVVDPAADGQWISMGDKKLHASHTDKVQVKFDTGYKDILPGMVVSFPLKVTQNGDKTYANGTLSGKVFNILDESNASAPQKPAAGSQQASKPSSGAGGKTTKVYGDIVSVSGSDVVVSTESGQVTVKLSEEQLGQIQNGGRLAGMRSEDGTIGTGFKTYGPKGSGAGGSAGAGSNGGSKGTGTFKKDNSGMETGHALNGALNLRRSGLTIPPVIEVAKVVHDVTKLLKSDALKDPANKGMSDYDIGAMCGHAVLNATRDVEVGDNDNPEEITGKLLTYARALMAEVVPAVSAYVKGESAEATPPQNEAATAPTPSAQVEDKTTVPVQIDNGHINMSPADMDFDMDIPF